MNNVRFSDDVQHLVSKMLKISRDKDMMDLDDIEIINIFNRKEL